MKSSVLENHFIICVVFELPFVSGHAPGLIKNSTQFISYSLVINFIDCEKYSEAVTL